MLRLQIPKQEFWDPIKEKFITISEVTVELEHSLYTVSLWESKWHIPFHDDRNEKTFEQNIDYIRCMCQTPNVDPAVFNYITEENAKSITDYISDSATATWFNDNTKRSGKREIITAEIIYYWMTAYNLPESYQHWHLNKLMTLLRVCAEKNNPDSAKKKKATGQLAAQRRALNAARRKKFNTRG